ncbi:MAG: Gfo/Idh/MocA family oxidoreductase [Candidatus Zixiibacteriota bacterium]
MLRSRDKLKVAVVGAGWVVSNRHVPSLLKSDLCDLVGVVDADPQRADKLQRRYRLKYQAGAQSLSEVEWMEEVQALSIGVSPMMHYQLTKEALNSGKHVILEKPMALTVEQGQDLCRIARQTRLTLSIVHNFQFTSSFLALKRMIAQGDMGEIRGIAAIQLSSPQRRLPSWYDTLPYGLFYDESPHLLYLLKSLAKGIRLLSAVTHPSSDGKSTPALITAHYTDDQNLPIFLYMNFESPISEWQLCVMGARKIAAVDVFRDVLVVIPCDRSHQATDILRTSFAAASSHFWGVFVSGMRLITKNLLYGNEEVFARFLKAVKTGAIPAEISSEDGLQVLRMQHEIMDKAQVLS